MASNPDPARITPAIWWLWQECQKLIPGVRLGGIFANKPGYHNAVNNLPSSDYSKQLRNDTHYGPKDKARAIDLTMGDAAMQKYSRRLLASGRDPNDPRGNYLREFYGTVDGRSVIGWDFQSVEPSSSDPSHLWHIHLSILTRWVNSMPAMRAILSILKGETVAQWRARESALIKGSAASEAPIAVKPQAKKRPELTGYETRSVLARLPKGLGKGSRGGAVLRLQALLRMTGRDVSMDGQYGPRTEAVVKAYQKAAGLPVTGRFVARDWDHLVKGGGANLLPVLDSSDKHFVVRRVQALLGVYGINVADTGTMDAATVAAVMKWQHVNGLPVTGVVERNDWSVLIFGRKIFK